VVTAEADPLDSVEEDSPEEDSPLPVDSVPVDASLEPVVAPELLVETVSPLEADSEALLVEELVPVETWEKMAMKAARKSPTASPATERRMRRARMRIASRLLPARARAAPGPMLGFFGFLWSGSMIAPVGVTG
jgi:hypothetical protein